MTMTRRLLEVHKMKFGMREYPAMKGRAVTYSSGSRRNAGESPEGSLDVIFDMLAAIKYQRTGMHLPLKPFFC
jgi:hypothetical protein